jgi:ankyrin repeat protein
MKRKGDDNDINGGKAKKIKIEDNTATAQAVQSFVPGKSSADLFAAVLAGDVGLIQSCVQNGLNVDSIRPADIDPDEKTPLIVAAMSDIPNKMQVLKTLLDLGANPNKTFIAIKAVTRNKDYFARKPLLIELCSTKNNLELIKLIFEHSKHEIDVNAEFVNNKKSTDNRTALDAAVRLKDIDLINYLIEKDGRLIGFDTSMHKVQSLKPALNCAVPGCRITEVIEEQFASQLKPNFIMACVSDGQRKLLNWIAEKASKEELNKALCLGAAIYDVKLVRWAIEAGADVNAVAKLDFITDRHTKALENTPLNYALSVEGYTSYFHVNKENQFEVIKILVDKGANVNAVDSEGRSPLIILASAVSYLYKDKNSVAKLLIENGANVNAKDKYGNTAISVCLVGKIEPNALANIPRPPLPIQDDLLKLLLSTGAIFTKNLINDAVRKQSRVVEKNKIIDIFTDLPLDRVLDLPTAELALSPEFVAHYPTELAKELVGPAGRAAHKIFRGGVGQPEQSINNNNVFAKLVADVMPEMFKYLGLRDIAAFFCTASQHDQQTRPLAQGEQRMVPYSLKVAKENVKATYPAKLERSEKSFVEFLGEKKAAAALKAAEGRQ